jgi:dTDP-4-amino-4,6-dideoxygalactose transaminase
MELWVNKGWGYGDPEPDHRWIAGNARLTDLQGAVALAQLAKLQGGVDNRIAMAAALSDRLAGLPGLTLPGPDDGDVHSYWRYPLHVDPDVVPGGPVAVAQALKEWAVPAAPRYIQKPAFRCGIFRDQKTLGSSRFPFSLARPEALDYADARFPGTLRYLETVLVLPWSERLTEEHIAYVAKAITAAVEP